MGRALAETDDGTLAVRTAAQEEIFMDSSLPDPEAIGNIAQPQSVMGLSFSQRQKAFMITRIRSIFTSTKTRLVT
jgi:hypothetical protein